MLKQDHYKTSVYKTPFHERTSELNILNEWYRWKDYTVPNSYFRTDLEYFAARNSTAVFDVTPMTKHKITGSESEAFVNRFFTRDMRKVAPGRVAYVVWCDEQGSVIDDGTVFHVRSGEYWLLCVERQLDNLSRCAIGFDVQVEEITDEVPGLAIQGPTSCSILKAMGFEGIENLKPFDLKHYNFNGEELMISRTGFTGDLGYEVFMPTHIALPFWDKLFAEGEIYGIKPMGIEALDYVRIEAGLLQPGVDFIVADIAVRPGVTRSPFEIGLSWQVDFSKPVFNGRQALLEEKKRGSKYTFLKLNIQGNKPAHGAYLYNQANKKIGTVTSAMFSPSAKANIAYASMNDTWRKDKDKIIAEIYYQTELEWQKVMAEATIVTKPFFEPERKRTTPAELY
ncbi:aminomethyltransferase family protein [Gammaproteobacteria bacterium]|jgi:aminomethyltransferase|nr:aminomethyltransferase family protein [Gammaproteobacteria bacterium]